MKIVQLELCSENVSGWLQEVLIKDPTVWLDGPRTPPKYVIAQSNNTFGVLAIFCCEYHSINIWDSSDSSSYDVGESTVKVNSTPTDFPV